MPKGKTGWNGDWVHIDRLAEIFNGAALQLDTLAKAIKPDGRGLERQNSGLPEYAKTAGPPVEALNNMNLIINNAARKVSSLAVEIPGGQRKTGAVASRRKVRTVSDTSI
jgi:hypothetical protein